MKILLFLVAVYSLIINQCHQKPSPHKMESTYYRVIPADTSIGSTRTDWYYQDNNLPENTGVATAATYHYSIASSMLLKE